MFVKNGADMSVHCANDTRAADAGRARNVSGNERHLCLYFSNMDLDPTINWPDVCCGPQNPPRNAAVRDDDFLLDRPNRR